MCISSVECPDSVSKSQVAGFECLSVSKRLHKADAIENEVVQCMSQRGVHHITELVVLLHHLTVLPARHS